MKKIVIRRAEFTDLDEILQIERESINSWSFNQFSQELKNSFAVFLVAECSGIIAGYIISWFVAGELQINSIAVESRFKRQGIGTDLLNSVITDCPSADVIFLEVRSRSIEAREFYRGRGFTETGTRKNYYGDDDALLMEKRIK